MIVCKAVSYTHLYAQQAAELERLANLTAEEAREQLLSKVEEEIKHETAIMIKDMESAAKEQADKKAREIISLAIQRCAADHVAETTVSVVALPNDEMKGRIIGREGRNIRTLETLTAVSYTHLDRGAVPKKVVWAPVAQGKPSWKLTAAAFASESR